MVILILINIVIIIFVYLKYCKISNNKQEQKETINNLDSIIMGYIEDKGFDNNFDLLIAEIIELNIKGYITIEYNEDNINKYNYIIKQNVAIDFDKVNDYEIHVLNFLFFKKTEVTKEELEERLKNTFKSYHIQYNELKSILNREVIKLGIIDRKKQEKANQNAKKYVRYALIITIVVLILGLLKILDTNFMYMSMFVLEEILIEALLLKSNIYTKKGQSIKFEIDNYKINLENKEFLIDNVSMKDVVLNKEFANSIALHVKTYAKEVFVSDIIYKDANKISRNAVINSVMIFTIILLLGIILYKIIINLEAQGLVWIFAIFAIIAAGVFDAAHALSSKKK